MIKKHGLTLYIMMYFLQIFVAVSFVCGWVNLLGDEGMCQCMHELMLDEEISG
jgi:hypothetical protein